MNYILQWSNNSIRRKLNDKEAIIKTVKSKKESHKQMCTYTYAKYVLSRKMSTK